MKKIFSLLLFLAPLFALAQVTETQTNTDINAVRIGTNTPTTAFTALTDLANSKISVLGYPTTGTNSYVISINPKINTYTLGLTIPVYFANGNTGASTLVINGLLPKSLVKNVSDPLNSGDIPAGGRLLWVYYDGTNFRVSLPSSGTGFFLIANNLSEGVPSTIRTNIGLGNVENTALSTWAGSTNLTTLGTIATGVFQGTPIADAYISSSATWNAKESALTFTSPLSRSVNTISIPLGTNSVDGYLSASDRTNFNLAYINRITSLTNTGASGASTLISNVLNIPNYTLSGLGGVPSTRNINTTSPITGGGDLSADRTIAINNAVADGSTKGVASFTAADFDASSGNISLDYTNGQKSTSSVPGFLSSTDWTTFNNKQSAGNYITTLTGDGTASGPGSVAFTLTTVNSNTGTFGSATQVAQTVFNGKGLATSVSNVTITPAVGSITGLGTGVAVWLGTPSWANFNTAITGTAPYWSLANGGTQTGINTLSSTTPSGLIFTNTSTANANNQFVEDHTGTFTSRNTNSDVINGSVIDYTLARNAGNPTGQTANTLLVNGTFSNTFATQNVLKLQNAGTDLLALNSAGALTHTLGANNITGLSIKRFTDTSPTGNFLNFLNAAGGSVFSVDAIGTITTTQGIASNQISSTSSSAPTGLVGGNGTQNSVNINPTGNYITTGATRVLLNLFSDAAKGFAYPSGTNTGNALKIVPLINNTGGTNTITLLNILATETSMTGTTLYGITEQTTSGLNGFGTATPTARMHVVGATKLDGNVTLVSAGNKFFVTEGSNGSVGQTTLVSGTKAVTVTGTTTSSRCFATLVSQGGTVTTTVAYGCACTANTVTITALTSAAGTDVTDTSIVNYWIVN